MIDTDAAPGSTEYCEFDAEDLLKYIGARTALTRHLGGHSGDWHAEELYGGNLNRVFVIRGPDGKVLVRVESNKKGWKPLHVCCSISHTEASDWLRLRTLAELAVEQACEGLPTPEVSLNRGGDVHDLWTRGGQWALGQEAGRGWLWSWSSHWRGGLVWEGSPQG